MLQIERVDVERPVERPAVPDPHCRAVKVDHEPLAWVEGQAVCVLNALHPSAEFWADEGRTGVRGVNVQPHLLIAACMGGENVTWLLDITKHESRRHVDDGNFELRFIIFNVLTNRPQLNQIIESTGPGGSQGGAQLQIILRLSS